MPLPTASAGAADAFVVCALLFWHRRGQHIGCSRGTPLLRREFLPIAEVVGRVRGQGVVEGHSLKGLHNGTSHILLPFSLTTQKEKKSHHDVEI